MTVDPKSLGLAYLATPYSKYVGGIELAFVDACKLAAKLMICGVKVYSPIAHTHPLAIHGGIDPFDHSIWQPFDEAMMAAAECLIVARMGGWKESFGIAQEIKFFEAAGKPIYNLNPQTLVISRRQTNGRHLNRHTYVPSAMHAGDCAECGHLQEAAIHIRVEAQ